MWIEALELVFMIALMFWVNRDVRKHGFINLVFWIWVGATVLAYYFLYSVVGVIIVFLLYLGWSRAFVKRMEQGKI